MDLRNRFEELVDRCYRPVLSYVFRLTGGCRDSEDLTHQAFLLAFERLARGEEFSGDPGRWLRGTARNLVRGWWRRARKAPALVADRLALAVAEDQNPAAAAAQAEEREALDHCIGQLVPKDRDVLAKRYEEGLKASEIAAQIRASVEAVYMRLSRIRQKLKLCVQRQLTGEKTR